MAEQKKGTLSLSCPTDLKKTESLVGKVRQSFSHGKTKVVTVEVKKKRALSRSPGGAFSSSIAGLQKSGDLTDKELETRLEVVKNSIKENREQEELRLKAEQEERERARIFAAEEEARMLAEIRAKEKAKEEEEKKREKEAEISVEVGEVSIIPPVAENVKKTQQAEPKVGESGRLFSHKTVRQKGSEEDDDSLLKSVAVNAKKAPPVKKDIKELKGRYTKGAEKISVYNALDGSDETKTRSLASLKRARQKNKFTQQRAEDTKIVKEVVLPETISVQELSNRMAVRTGDVVKTLMKLGVMVTANQIIDNDTAELIVLEFGHKVKRVSDSDIEIGLKREDTEENLLPRPPVVTIMGHVDHGKTSLLDALRKTDVALSEAGGITQCIGAYQVTMSDGKKITFIDTPGHAAFTEMRSRGANVTDIVVLVVAADDSVNDQTVEAINHAKAAKVPMILAINKMDKYGVNPDNVRKDLLQHEVVVESYGGETMDVEISAKMGLNLHKLEEVILLQAEMLDLKANPNREAEGIVIESKLEKGLGPVATVLINKGTLKLGDIFVSGTIFGRVRAIRNYRGDSLRELTPGAPGEIIGFDGPTVPGDDFVVVETETKAREIASYRDRKKREQAWVISSRTTVDQMFSELEAAEKLQVLSIIVKADVQGSSEAICSSLRKLSTDEVSVKIIHAGIGEITENDVSLARASQAIILGFNVRSNMQARDQIARDRIQVKYYSIIYDLVNDIKSIMSGLLTPDIKENVLGSAEVRKIFDVSKFGRIAGCMVIDGVIKRGTKARLIRNGAVVHTGSIKSVRRVKDDVKEVKSGFECGISLENYNDIHLSDIIECFELEEVARQL
ncbi:MAG: translation initiation factor IF-2 [Holosporaceae bacterium]|jgi:translation initiation factor IF-2|nr:translation initiation factor IF-2 [Holosporaceae bacterium]